VRHALQGVAVYFAGLAVRLEAGEVPSFALDFALLDECRSDVFILSVAPPGETVLAILQIARQPRRVFGPLRR